MTIQPQSDAHKILDSINAILRDESHFLDQNSFQIKKLVRDANQIKDASQKLVLLGAIAQLCGDKEYVDIRFHAAKTASGNDAFVGLQHCYALGNLGFFSEALEEYSKLQILENGLLSSVEASLLGFLATDFLCALYAKGNEMKMANLLSDKVELAHRAKAVMDMGNISDELASQILDEAGSVMREHKLMRSGGGSAKMQIEDKIGFQPFLMITWCLPITYKEAATMNAELADRMVRRFENIPDCLSVGFQGSQQ